jgi:ATP-dependent DNA helicase RecG
MPFSLFKEIQMTGTPQRREIYEIPPKALRESIVNAVLHRDYVEMGARVMVEVFDDRVEISDPGGLPPSLKPEEFGTRSVLRNPEIADLLLRTGYIERMGTGIKRIEDLCQENGTSAPTYEFTGFFTTIYTRESYLSHGTQPAEQVKRLLTCLKSGSYGVRDIMLNLNLHHRPTFLDNYLKPAMEAGLVGMTQPDSPKSPTQKYRLTGRGREVVGSREAE